MNIYSFIFYKKWLIFDWYLRDIGVSMENRGTIIKPNKKSWKKLWEMPTEIGRDDKNKQRRNKNR